MYTILASQHPALRSEKYEALILACAVTHAAGLELPTPQVVRWMEPFVGAYDNDPLFWQPYEVLDSGDVVLKVWARGGYGYLASNLPAMLEIPEIKHVDPASWHGRLHELRKHVMDTGMAGALEVAIEQTNPVDPYWGAKLTEFHDTIRSAAHSGKLLTDPAAIRRRMRRLKSSDFAPVTD